jgi:hypothetical protein
MVGPTFWRGSKSFRNGGEIWIGLKNVDSFRGYAGVKFFVKPPNFGVETHLEAQSCSNGGSRTSGYIKLTMHIWIPKHKTHNQLYQYKDKLRSSGIKHSSSFR